MTVLLDRSPSSTFSVRFDILLMFSSLLRGYAGIRRLLVLFAFSFADSRDIPFRSFFSYPLKLDNLPLPSSFRVVNCLVGISGSVGFSCTNDANTFLWFDGLTVKVGISNLFNTKLEKLYRSKPQFPMSLAFSKGPSSACLL